MDEPYICAFLSWQYNEAYFTRGTSNQSSKIWRTGLGTVPRSCADPPEQGVR
jgi:hypothetical protein